MKIFPHRIPHHEFILWFTVLHLFNHFYYFRFGDIVIAIIIIIIVINMIII